MSEEMTDSERVKAAELESIEKIMEKSPEEAAGRLRGILDQRKRKHFIPTISFTSHRASLLIGVLRQGTRTSTSMKNRRYCCYAKCTRRWETARL